MFDIYEFRCSVARRTPPIRWPALFVAIRQRDVARRTFPGTVVLWQKLAESGGPLPRSAFSDEHGTDLQRAYNYLCMAYGAHRHIPSTTSDNGFAPKIPCGQLLAENQQSRMPLRRTMLPHIDRAKMKVVNSKEWLLPEGAKPFPS